ncbi:bifunctional diaminohydroxyphosphoribosylaminopyrimidine deaminase/5-amino-6-(5-phosphoribosylamino)uracil reductase RibD [Niabella soli]|uniref:Riboflavin biosynthesis protein RibD n=1 Tax=Niabella soli DSM 19437 TaxID=929713 RepID=W0EZK6_9BACT|nr:bifunctional diaminohydroxyphosphoribosylaminopyrimidine deaminase/5-amino-6-(5-phosphoribosylamino)uracil reductase RibD [Niabella soli]AHF14634.1 riboflavin biosynthesis protein RibD [Niabella soli DSM 19437]
MEHTVHSNYLRRCFQLAQLGAGNVAPNPMVGAVLVFDDKIIGEGYHQRYGEAHAEVHCINNALKSHPDLICHSTLYVSLEPCSHFGKTPPCADLIIQHRIPKVVIGCRDSFEAVNGRGVERLRNAGVAVVEHILEQEAMALNKRFFTFHQLKRPYIILKWAQTKNNVIGSNDDERLLITSAVTNRLVHQWRTEEAAIMVGAKTAVKDDPLLDNRNWYGNPPVKIIVSASGNLPGHLKLFQSGAPVLVFTTQQGKDEGQKRFIKVAASDFLDAMLRELHQLQLQSVLVEGGAQLLKSFIDAGLWDEARVITHTTMVAASGVQAPRLHNEALLQTEIFLTDEVAIYKNNTNHFIGSDG